MKKSVILCIDDERLVLDSLKTELKEQFGDDHIIELAESPEDAIEMFQELIDDGYEMPLVISDYIMPNIKGDELLKRFHEISPTTLKIMLTGQATTEGVTNAVNWARLYRYISKPWEAKDLTLTVNEAIKSFYREQKLEIQNKELKQMNEVLEVRVIERTQVIHNKNIVLEEQKNELDAKNKNITDSINAAKRIQQALLPSNEIFAKSFSDYFVFYKPKDIVSGDFYWAKKIGSHVFYAVADCTGHGVPGALMSILGISSLNQILNKYSHKDFTNLTASEVLDSLREKIINAFSQTDKKIEQKEGMDIALCMLNLDTNELQYSGAYNSLCIARHSDNKYGFEEIKPDKMPVGYTPYETHNFTNHKLKVNKGDILYIYSDGYADQFGGKCDKKFMSRKFKELLHFISDKPMTEQKALLELNFTEWKGDNCQVDDILVIGLKV